MDCTNSSLEDNHLTSSPECSSKQSDCIIVIGRFGWDHSKKYLPTNSFSDDRLEKSTKNEVGAKGSEKKYIWDSIPMPIRASSVSSLMDDDGEPIANHQIEWKHPTKALFQIGRSLESFIDFVVRDVGRIRNCPVHSSIDGTDKSERESTSETISIYNSFDSNDENFSDSENDQARMISNETEGDELFNRRENYAFTDDEGDEDVAEFNYRKSELVSEDDWKPFLKFSVSRLACRIFIESKPNGINVSKLYDGAFRSDGVITVGNGAKIWQTDDPEPVTDAFTTNGTWLWRPEIDPLQKTPSAATRNLKDVKGTCWQQVSVRGDVFFPDAQKQDIPQKRTDSRIDNVLVDFSLIHLSGVTLLWRSAAGMARGITDRDILSMLVDFCDRFYQCPHTKESLVLYSAAVVDDTVLKKLKDASPQDKRAKRDTYVLSQLKISESQQDKHITERAARVYFGCGHVQSNHNFDGVPYRHVGDNVRTCPNCKVKGRVAMMQMGMESAFWLDHETPSYAFDPCGHIASEKTIRYWISVAIPHGKTEFVAKCPFCAEKIEDVGFVKLEYI